MILLTISCLVIGHAQANIYMYMLYIYNNTNKQGVLTPSYTPDAKLYTWAPTYITTFRNTNINGR